LAEASAGGISGDGTASQLVVRYGAGAGPEDCMLVQCR
jgi:hypothetical protein